MLKEVSNGLTEFPIPVGLDPESDRMKKIMCYNRNVHDLKCKEIRDEYEKFNIGCRLGCPYYTENMKLDIKVMFFAFVKHETEKAFLVDDDKVEFWLPKKLVDSVKQMQDGLCLFIIPKWIALQNGVEP